jgi:hypothetical protein
MEKRTQRVHGRGRNERPICTAQTYEPRVPTTQLPTTPLLATNDSGICWGWSRRQPRHRLPSRGRVPKKSSEVCGFHLGSYEARGQSNRHSPWCPRRELHYIPVSSTQVAVGHSRTFSLPLPFSRISPDVEARFASPRATSNRLMKRRQTPDVSRRSAATQNPLAAAGDRGTGGVGEQVASPTSLGQMKICMYSLSITDRDVAVWWKWYGPSLAQLINWVVNSKSQPSVFLTAT